MKSILSLMLLAASSLSSAAQFPLTILNWEDYLDQNVIEQWESETGIAIHQVYYDDEAQRNLILASPSAKQIDLVVVDRSSIDVVAEAGYLSPVAKQSGLSLYWPDACSTYGQQYLWGTYGIVYRADKLSRPISSWRELLIPDESIRGHIGMLGQADELLTSSLSFLGYPVSSNDDKQLKEAFELLKRQSPYVVTYDYIYSYVLAHPEQEEVWVAPAYSGDQDGLSKLQGKGIWQYAAPEEGSIVWVDCLAITASSAHKETAQRFVDFVSRLDMSAKNSEALWVASPYKEAAALQSKALLNSGEVYLTAEQMAKAKIFPKLSGTQILKRTRIKDALIRYHDSH